MALIYIPAYNLESYEYFRRVFVEVLCHSFMKFGKGYIFPYEIVGSRTIAPWTIAPWIIAPRIIAPKQRPPEKLPPGNWRLDNCPQIITTNLCIFIIIDN